MDERHAVGTVREIWRYPVKSMLGELLRSVEIETRGLEGDRICAFRDRETGKVASAKLPHRWKGLLTCQAVLIDDDISIILPDGAVIAPEEAAVALSEMLGRRVDLILERPEGLQLDRADPNEVCEHGSSTTVDHTVMPIGLGAPEGGFFDALPIHFVTDASLAEVAAGPAHGVKQAARFRPNIVINAVSHVPFQENGWVGGNLRIGENLRLAVLFPTPRCAVPTLRHGEIEPDPRIVHRISQLNKVPILNVGEKPCLGAYAVVLATGMVRVGDTVSLERP